MFPPCKLLYKQHSQKQAEKYYQHLQGQQKKKCSKQSLYPLPYPHQIHSALDYSQTVRLFD